MNPVQWWHELQGGAIAQQRPPPPNADAPYPNLGSLPAKPAMPDPAARQRIFSGLQIDRANAQYEAATTPIPAPARPGAAPGLLAGGQSDPSAASATLAAASAPPARTPAAPPSLARPAGPTAAAATPSAELPGPPPSIPTAPPPPPQIAGVGIPATKPTPPPVAPPSPATVAKLAASAATPLAVGFKPGSAVLPPAAGAGLKQLAGQRGNHPVEVIGFGDADDATPEVQAAGVGLALARARAIVAALTASGVPAASIRMDAQASGHGGAARLIE